MPPMKMIRTGIGFDAHRFAANRRMVLGGVEFKHELGLDGHSDADVLCHAIMDAMLGAVADGDIGQHFPDTDPKWKDASSLKMLEHVAERIRLAGARVVNLDSTVLAERPKLAPHILEMRHNIAHAAGIDPSCVSIKATTMEKMGAIGREEGIAAMAVATVEEGTTKHAKHAK